MQNLVDFDEARKKLRWFENGTIIIDSPFSTQHYDWIMSDRGNTNNMRGLTILTRKDGKVGIREVRDIDKNIMSAIMEHKEQAEDWLVNVHAPNTNASSFYAQLGSVVNGHPRKNRTIILGDFNSQIGKEDSDEEDILRLGKHIGHTYTNENGEYMKNFLRIHNVIQRYFNEI